MKNETRKIDKIYFLGLIPILILIIMSSMISIETGKKGVLLNFGAVTGKTLNEGLNFVIPFVNRVDIFDTKTLKYEADASAASKDLQIVTSKIALNYRLNGERLVYLRQNIGLDWERNIIQPAIQEAIKATTSQFTAEELVTKRPVVREQMKIALNDKLKTLSSDTIIPDEFNIVNFDFSAEFNKAIEQKVTAEQLALKANRDLERIKIEAQQKIEQAKAEAESITIQSKALKDSPDVLQLRWIEKWNGITPLVVGNNGNLITIPLTNITGNP